jgi:hypothetical protein
MSRLTISYFANYFYDIYSEYITPCAVMTYATLNATQITHPMFASYGLVRLSG